MCLKIGNLKNFVKFVGSGLQWHFSGSEWCDAAIAMRCSTVTIHQKMDRTTETCFTARVAGKRSREAAALAHSESEQTWSPHNLTRRRPPPRGAEQDVLPHRAGAEHAAAPAALRAAPPRQARLQAHQGRRGHLQVGFAIPLLNLARAKRRTAWAALRWHAGCRVSLALALQRAARVRGGDHGCGGHRQGAHPRRHGIRHLPRQVPVRRLQTLQGRDPRGCRHHGE